MTAKMTIRLPDELYEELRKAVYKNRNSLNQEMILRIAQYDPLIQRVKKLEGLEDEEN